jgi:hypothetical protein
MNVKARASFFTTVVLLTLHTKIKCATLTVGRITLLF